MVTAAQDIDPNFKTLKTEGFTITVQETGRKYEIGTVTEEVQSVLADEKEPALDDKRIRDFIKANGRLPEGLISLPRKTTIVVRERK